MNTLTTKQNKHGGRRSFQPGRPPAGRKHIGIRVKVEILERLGPGAAAKIRELVEATYGDKS